ncbi:hypothetical protein HanIR_Chr10g0501071 [Helianthus annuus]|nr:hypothetical protein HanIR_Chr10g0501071 [Helianthus annuus]
MIKHSIGQSQLIFKHHRPKRATHTSTGYENTWSDQTSSAGLHLEEFSHTSYCNSHSNLANLIPLTWPANFHKPYYD